MSLKQIVQKLSGIEKQALQALQDGRELNTEEIASKAGLNIDAVRRAMSWLNDKKLAVMKEKKTERILLSKDGESALKEGLPEKQLLRLLEQEGGKAELKVLEEELGLGKQFNFALGVCKKNNFVTLAKKDGKIHVMLTGVEKEFLRNGFEEEKILEKAKKRKELESKEKERLKELEKRGLVERKQVAERSLVISNEGKKALEMLGEVKGELNVLSASVLRDGSWREKTFKAYNLQDPVSSIFAGKKQPYIQFLSSIRKKLVELGFEEMESPLITQEFYNFDVLFQPQNHPARSWSDTYQLKKPKLGKLPEKKIVRKIKEAHEFGGKTLSTGWQYSWSEEIARKCMPAAHTTAHSARQLVKGVKVPGKYFSIARCYRPDVVDATHLIEFNQMEGFVVDESFNFRHLLGMLKQFAIEIAGAEQVKFYPDYYPFTEPSVQLSAKHPELGWIEFGGAGIFRPEMIEVLGIKGTALAWGLGIDRLAMCKLGIKDIRYLFSDDLKWLRNAKMIGSE